MYSSQQQEIFPHVMETQEEEEELVITARHIQYTVVEAHQLEVVQ